MMKYKKEIDFATDVNEQLINQMANSKFVKYGSRAIIVAGGLILLGLAFKISNYTIGNFKKLTATLKNN
jgi:hypothetical protein